MSINANIIQVQNFSVNDGEGIRTTIFFMGCPLRCQWCSNPETWTQEYKVFEIKKRIKKCELCGYQTRLLKQDICSDCQNKLSLISDKTTKQMGYSVSVEDLVNKIKRQEIFYRFSNGGVTFSGGEPTQQYEFILELAKQLSNLGIDLSMETSAYFDYDKTKELLEYLDHIFIDIKIYDKQEHIKYTGVSNELILENIIKIKELKIPITIRMPLIKEINCSDKNIKQIIEYLNSNFMEYPINVELLPYHNYGNEKYDYLALTKNKHEFTTPNIKEIIKIKEMFIENNIEIIDYK